MGREEQSAGPDHCVTRAGREDGADSTPVPLPKGGDVQGNRKHGRRSELLVQNSSVTSRGSVRRASANRDLNGRLWESREAAAGRYETNGHPSQCGQKGSLSAWPGISANRTP